jgi:hypothetical protein
VTRRPQLEVDRLSSSHLRALGLVTAHCALLDTVIERLIWKLKGLEPAQGLSVTAFEWSLGGRLKLLKVAAKGGPIEKRVRALVTSVKKSAKSRNALVHARWTGMGSDDHTLVATWNLETYRLEAELWSAHEIEAIAKEIAALTIEARNIIASL